jgi:flagellar motor switch protein FliG
MQSYTLRKSAILVAALEPELADALLQQMPNEDAHRIRTSILEMTRVEESEAHVTIDEFLHAIPTCAGLPAGVGRGTTPKTDAAAVKFFLDPQSPEDARAAQIVTDRLRETSSAVLVRLLHHELPQTIAVVLSQVTAARAAEVASWLPSDTQVEVLRRLVEMDPGAVFEKEMIRDELGQWILEWIDREAERSDLVDRLSDIVSAASDAARDRLSASLAITDQGLVEGLHDDPHSRAAAQISPAARDDFAASSPHGVVWS